MKMLFLTKQLMLTALMGLLLWPPLCLAQQLSNKGHIQLQPDENQVLHILHQYILREQASLAFGRHDHYQVLLNGKTLTIHKSGAILTSAPCTNCKCNLIHKNWAQVHTHFQTIGGESEAILKKDGLKWRLILFTGIGDGPGSWLQQLEQAAPEIKSIPAETKKRFCL